MLELAKAEAKQCGAPLELGFTSARAIERLAQAERAVIDCERMQRLAAQRLQDGAGVQLQRYGFASAEASLGVEFEELHGGGVGVKRTVPGEQADLLGVSAGAVLRCVQGMYIDGLSLSEVADRIRTAKQDHATLFLELQPPEQPYDATLAALGIDVNQDAEPPRADAPMGVDDRARGVGAAYKPRWVPCAGFTFDAHQSLGLQIEVRPQPHAVAVAIAQARVRAAQATQPAPEPQSEEPENQSAVGSEFNAKVESENASEADLAADVEVRDSAAKSDVERFVFESDGALGIEFKQHSDGVRVLQLVAGGQAEKLGVAVGALLHSVEAQLVTGLKLTAVAEQIRDAKSLSPAFTLHFVQSQSSTRVSPGVATEDSTAAAEALLREPEAMVTGCVPGSQAEAMGVEPGWVIIRVQGEAVMQLPFKEVAARISAAIEGTEDTLFGLDGRVVLQFARPRAAAAELQGPSDATEEQQTEPFDDGKIGTEMVVADEVVVTRRGGEATAQRFVFESGELGIELQDEGRGRGVRVLRVEAGGQAEQLGVAAGMTLWRVHERCGHT